MDLAALGPHFERHEAFPARTNTEFVEVWPGAGCCGKLRALHGLVACQRATSPSAIRAWSCRRC